MKINYVTNCVTVSAKLLSQFISMNKTVSPKARTNPCIINYKNSF